MRERILLIDDEQSVHDAVLVMHPGLQLVSAYSGLQGLDILMDDGAFSMVIVDHHMPDITGLQLLPLFKARYPYIPVVLISSDSQLEDEALRLGAARFFEKPFPEGLSLNRILKELTVPC